jgi:hypothetical protein
MPQEDAWNWILLYYVGTVLLHMSIIEFWKCTPKKLQKLVDMHIELNSASTKSQNKPESGFIDQIW